MVWWVLVLLVCLGIGDLHAAEEAAVESDQRDLTSGEKALEHEFDLDIMEIRGRMEDLLSVHIDYDGDGFVSRDELIDWMIFLHDKALKRSLESKLLDVDRDGDGVADVTELINESRNMAVADGHNFTDNDEKEIRLRFAAADSNDDGYLDFDELMSLLDENPENKVAEIDAKVVITESDENSDGMIDLNEALLRKEALMDLFADHLGEEDLDDDKVKEAFAILDENGDGYIGVDELTRVFEQMIEDPGTQLREFIDGNADSLLGGNAQHVVDKDGEYKNEGSAFGISVNEILEQPELFEKWVRSVATDSGEVLMHPENFNFNDDDDDLAFNSGFLKNIDDEDFDDEYAGDDDDEEFTFEEMEEEAEMKDEL